MIGKICKNKQGKIENLYFCKPGCVLRRKKVCVIYKIFESIKIMLKYLKLNLII